MGRLVIWLLVTVFVSGAGGAVVPHPLPVWADFRPHLAFRSERPTSVEIDSGRLVAVVQLDPWHLVVKERSTNRRLVEEYPVERRGRDGSDVGALGFLVSGKGGSRQGLGQWYRVTSVLGVTRERDAVHVVAATDDPSGRRLEIRLWFPSPTTVALRITPRPADGVLEVAEGLASESGEHYLGLGARFGSLDARGMEVRARVQEELDTVRPEGNHVPVPFFVSSRAYGVAVHGTQESAFQLNTVRPDAAVFKVLGSTLHFTLLTGPSPLDVVTHHATMVGPPALPPLWAFGVWKTVLGGDERVLAEAERLRQHRLPVNALWSYDMVDARRHLGWKPWVYRPVIPGPYRDLASLTSRLHAMGYRTLGYVSPEFRTDSPLFSVGSAHRYFIRDQQGRPYVMPGMQGHPVALLDFTNPEAVHWWQFLTSSILNELGFDGWMQDGGDRAPEDGVYFSGVTGAEARNAYPVAYACATHEAAIRARPDYVSFMRAGFVGSQRHTPLTWQCDNVFSWSQRDGMPAALRAALSGSVSGFPFWAPDIGGYSGCGAGWEADEELWIRWVQLGALHPVMRDHLGHKCRWALDLWTTPATIAAFRQYAGLHQRLVPYIYGLAVDAVERGFPLMRPVALISPDDPRAWEDEFTYLLGGDLLVAPVMEPGARQRRLFVPAGEWIDWWDGKRYAGPAMVTVAASLDRIPLFVRAGAILPLAPPSGSLTRASQSRGSDVPLILRVYPVSDAIGQRRLTLFDGVEMTVRRTVTGGLAVDLTGAPSRRTLLLVLVGEPEPPLSVRAHGGSPISPASARLRHTGGTRGAGVASAVRASGADAVARPEVAAVGLDDRNANGSDERGEPSCRRGPASGGPVPPDEPGKLRGQRSPATGGLPPLVAEGRCWWTRSPDPANPVACATCHHELSLVRPWAASFPKFKPLPPPHARVMTLLQANAEAVARHYRLTDSRPMATAITAYLTWLAAGLPVTPGISAGQPVFAPRLRQLEASTARGRALYASRCAGCHVPSRLALVLGHFPRLANGEGESLESFVERHRPGGSPLPWDGDAMADLVAYLVSWTAGRPLMVDRSPETLVKEE